LKPIFKWPGGKAREISFFEKYIPSFERYLEPFVGGGALYFHLCPDKSTIADVEEEVINFYLQIKKGNSKEIYDIISKWENDADTYYHVRDDLWRDDNLITRAARFYFLNKTSFRGMIRYNKDGKFNIPFGNYKRCPNFENLLEDSFVQQLRKTEILLCDYSEIFSKYNSPENFLFLDPPYDSEFSDYGGKYHFREKEHRHLAEMFKSTKNRCLLVIGKTDFTYNLYKDYVIDEYNKAYNFRIYHGRVGKEIDKIHLIIKNF
jgi:DNA adenine methylase